MKKINLNQPFVFLFSFFHFLFLLYSAAVGEGLGFVKS